LYVGTYFLTEVHLQCTLDNLFKSSFNSLQKPVFPPHCWLELRPAFLAAVNSPPFQTCFWGQGCQIFRGTIYQNGETIQNDHKIYQSAIKQLNGPNGQKMYQHLPLQDPQNFTQIGIFGLKLYHLATLFGASYVHK
jgi:hypothetical protein